MADRAAADYAELIKNYNMLRKNTVFNEHPVHAVVVQGVPWSMAVHVRNDLYHTDDSVVCECPRKNSLFPLLFIVVGYRSIKYYVFPLN